MNASVQRSDDDLLCRARGGEASAFAELFARHAALLERTATLMVGPEHDAADLVQETARRAFGDLQRFQGRSAFGTWLYGILLNLCRNFLRDRSRRAALVANETLDRQPAATGRRQGVLSSILRRETAARVEDSIQRLPIPLREAFLLHTVNGLDYAAVAAAVGCTEGTARVRAFRARALLRAELGEMVESTFGPP